MKSLPEIIAEVCEDAHVPMAAAVFGQAGIDAIFAIMETATELYREVDPERVTGEIIIFCVVVPTESSFPEQPSGAAQNFGSLASQVLTDLALQVGVDGRPSRVDLGSANLAQLSAASIVYHYKAGVEVFLAGAQGKRIRQLDSSARSQFSVPTFATLRDALRVYGTENVRESTCYIFRHVWSDPNRLFFKAGPEEVMRDSLTQFLRNRMGGEHDIWPEQNVNEKNPVDIRVQPKFTNNRLILIEIKWVGYSVAADGHITARHEHGRAQKGANQLAEYIDEQLQSAPSRVIQGCYVIIDGRRNNLREGATAISRADGLHFESMEFTFAPAHHQSRKDFDPPYRMFARPICV